jgi:hypothetical protein
MTQLKPSLIQRVKNYGDTGVGWATFPSLVVANVGLIAGTSMYGPTMYGLAAATAFGFGSGAAVAACGAGIAIAAGLGRDYLADKLFPQKSPQPTPSVAESAEPVHEAEAERENLRGQWRSTRSAYAGLEAPSETPDLTVTRNERT